MTYEFTENQLKTIQELREICDQHDYYLSIYVTTGNIDDSHEEVYEAIMDQLNKNKNECNEKYILTYIKDHIKIINTQHIGNHISFMINSKKSNHTAIYLYGEYDVTATLQLQELNDTENDKEFKEDLSQIIAEWDDVNTDEFLHYYMHAPAQSMYGWWPAMQAKQEEYLRCYRPGMAVKFFGDILCDFFDEKRIERVY